MRLRTFALIAAVAILAGCGKTGSHSTVDTTPDDPSIPVPSFATGSTMDRIQKADKLEVGTSFTQGFFSTQNSSKEISGFDTDLAEYVAQAIFGGTRADARDKLDFTQAEANNRETFLQDGSVDIALGAYQITPARQSVINFAGPYYEAQAQALVKANDVRLNVTSDLNGRNVCVPSTSGLAQALTSAAPQTNVVPKPTLQQCLDALSASSVASVVGVDWTLAPVVTKDNSLRVLSDSFARADYGIGVKQGDTAFRQFLNTTLQKFEDDKSWQNAFSENLGSNGVPASQPPLIDKATTSPNASVATTTTSTSISSTSLATSTTTSTTQPDGGSADSG